MLAPLSAFFLIFSYWPMGGLILAFKEYGFNTGIFGGEWVGFKYFEQFFGDSTKLVLCEKHHYYQCFEIVYSLTFSNSLLALMFNEVNKNNKWQGNFPKYLVSALLYILGGCSRIDE